MQKNVYRGITACYCLGRYFERYRLHLKVFWEGEAHNFITGVYDGEALCQATMFWSRRLMGRKGVRSQGGNFYYLLGGRRIEKQIGDPEEYEYSPCITCVHRISPSQLDFLMCNEGRKQVTEDAKELVQREILATPKRTQGWSH